MFFDRPVKRGTLSVDSPALAGNSVGGRKASIFLTDALRARRSCGQEDVLLETGRWLLAALAELTDPMRLIRWAEWTSPLD